MHLVEEFTFSFIYQTIFPNKTSKHNQTQLQSNQFNKFNSIQNHFHQKLTPNKHTQLTKLAESTQNKKKPHINSAQGSKHNCNPMQMQVIMLNYTTTNTHETGN